MAILTSDTLYTLLVSALCAKGFSSVNAEALGRQTIKAEQLGQTSVGVAHVFDYINSIDNGRIDGQAAPAICRPAPTMIQVDGNGGLAQTGFDQAFDDLVAGAHELGMCAFLQKNTMLCGSLGTFAMRVADAGLISIAATNGSPLLAGSGSSKPVYCTNPLAFSAPLSDRPPLLIDQSSSATAYVNIRHAAEQGDNIPLGWAIDKHGKPTTDARAALEGTLLAFGGARGANMALMVEVLAGGLTGANWSLDAPSFVEGNECPATGLFVLALDPTLIDAGFSDRLTQQIDRLANDYDVYIPGYSKAAALTRSMRDGIEVNDSMISQLQSMI